MRKALISFTLLSVVLPAGFSQVNLRQKDPSWRLKECSYQTLQKGNWTVWEIKKTIQCAIDKWPVQGGFKKALTVAECESGSDLRDPGGDGYIGTFQQAERYWSGRRNEYNPPTWKHPLAKWGDNPRSNVIVSIKMAHAKGWTSDWPICGRR